MTTWGADEIRQDLKIYVKFLYMVVLDSSPDVSGDAGLWIS
jgi:hypothetical protein